MIIDYGQFNKFIDLMPELRNDEVYFLSLSARNKYLNASEREYYALGRTEMFGRVVVKSKDDFYRAIRKLEALWKIRTTNNGRSIPEKCLVVYANVNPSSTIKAYSMLQKTMNEQLTECMMALQKRKEPNYTAFRNVERRLMNSIQKATARRCYVDIDFDLQDPELLDAFSVTLGEVKHHIIETQGGYHILIDKETLVKEIKLHEMVKRYNDIAVENDGEVIFNKNMMVPVPGTAQAGHLVKII